MSSNGHVQIRDYSDREILAMILDLSAQGDTTTRDLAVRVYGWGHIEGRDVATVRHGCRCVGSRLSWMKRFGLIEKGEKPGEWSVSAIGLKLARQRMQSDTAVTIKRTPDERTLDLANLVGERMVAAGPVAGTAMRRELQFQIQKRRRA